MDDDSNTPEHEMLDEFMREVLGDNWNESDPVPLRESSLGERVLDFRGNAVHCVPFEGWGWAAYDSDDWTSVESLTLRAPPRFQVEVVEFFDWNGKRRGGIGRVLTSESKFFDLWALFYTYHESGVFDFESNLSHYWIHIGINRPELFPEDHEPSGKYWPLPKFGNCRRYSGMAVLAVSDLDADKLLGFNV